MIKLSSIVNEIEDEEHEKWRVDWMKRYEAKLDKKGRLVAYHGTIPKNAKLIKQKGFKSGSYFSLKPEYSRRITSTYHDIPENKVVVFEVHLPLDGIDFVAGDIYSTRDIKFEETI